MGNNDMMRCVTKKKTILLICTKTKSIEKIRNNQMFKWIKKFQLFLKQEILIHANIKQLLFIYLKF
jgi:hypothetical protein